jgi:hypothetical protein
MARAASRSNEKRVTRDVEPTALRELLDDPPRVTITFVTPGGVEVLPTMVRVTPAEHRFAVRDEAADDLDGREVVLLLDGGAYWFELRGMSLRGEARRSSPPPGEAGGLVWYTLAPRRVTAWDYSTIRET